MGGVSLLDKWRLLQAALCDSGLSPAAKVVLGRLLHHHNSLTGQCSPSYETLARGAGLARRSAMRAVQELREAGWLRLDRATREGTREYLSNSFSPNFDRAVPTGEVVTERSPGSDETVTTPGDEPVTTLVTKRSPGVVTKRSPKQEKREQEKGNRESISASPAFDRWWSTYPKRTGKVDARKAYDRAITKGIATADTLQAGAERYAAQMAAEGRRQQHIKDAAGWINGQRWNDEPAPGRPGGLNGANRTGHFSALDYVAARIADDE